MFSLDKTWDICHLFYPFRMRRFNVHGSVIAHECRHRIERQSFPSEMSRWVLYVCEPQAFRSLVLQIVFVLMTVKNWRLHLLKYVRFTNILLHIFHASVKTPLPGGKISCKTKDVFKSSKLLHVFCKLTKHFCVICIVHVIVAVPKVWLVTCIVRRIAK